MVGRSLIRRRCRRPRRGLQLDAESSFSSGGLKTMLAWPPTTQRARGCRGVRRLSPATHGAFGKKDREVSPTSGGELTGVCVDDALPE